MAKHRILIQSVFLVLASSSKVFSIWKSVIELSEKK